MVFNKLFALKLFEGFSIQRWNDRIRPIDLNEMDRCGHKMMIAYFIGKIEEKSGRDINWEKIIYGGFFELLKKIMLSDIKAPVHRRIKEKYPKEFEKLNDWVVEQYEILIEDSKLLNKFREYLVEKENLDDVSFKVLRAAHKYSTLRELEIIQNSNPLSDSLDKIKDELDADLKKFRDLSGLKQLLEKEKLYDLLIKIEQLRFQVRWSQTPRIPKTSVIGHSMLVACLAFLLSRNINTCNKRIYNNFFCGLFHDLPESVTRDIISPVKNATDNLPQIVKKIEEEIVEEELFPLMDSYIKKEILYFTKDEFKNKILNNGEVDIVSFEEVDAFYNSDKYSPLDGKLVKLADEISVFLEAYQSQDHGIRSHHLEQGLNHILRKYRNEKSICGIDLRRFFREFE